MSEAPYFQSTHNLPFESCLWEINPEWNRFRVGTCVGLWKPTLKAYEILTVCNSEPGNGHFNDVLEWFYNSCERDSKCLIIREFLNKKFKNHLMQYEGFKKLGQSDLVKTFNKKSKRQK